MLDAAVQLQVGAVVVQVVARVVNVQSCILDDLSCHSGVPYSGVSLEILLKSLLWSLKINFKF